MIERDPIRFSNPEWLGVDEIGEEDRGTRFPAFRKPATPSN